MSAVEEPETEAAEDPGESEEPGESDGMSERTAKAVLLMVGLLAMWGIVAVLPETAYFVAGIMACRGWQKARGWIDRRSEDEASEPELEAEETVAGAAETWRVPTFHELCESLARVGTPHAHIAVLAHDLGTTPERVREALDACGVPVEAVRMQGRGSSTGVKGGALPIPRPTLGGVVGAGHPGNNDNNNGPDGAPEKGLRVEPIGQSGTLIHNPVDAVRHHQVGK
ncbi:hypothetical protein ACFXKI_09715 [Streptomyces mirabilis]|uniref:hypothetical protein n=1 Tax=Streptomyces mirabilis TaxID=68239 RepID=UPI00367609DD